jgi:hypothetical protein
VLKVAKELKKIKFVIAGYLQDPEYFIELKMKKVKMLNFIPT